MANKDLWYKDGLHFNCQQCGKCCTGAPGYVWLTMQDEQKISEHLKISIEEFRKKYTRTVRGFFSLKEKTNSYDCIFFENNKCNIYKARPLQCITFPLWKDNIKTKQDWLDLKKSCPGIDKKGGRFFTLEEINNCLN
jgi:Fe-S-cluster containining protein